MKYMVFHFQHFGKGDYDFVKFNGKTKVSRDMFWKRKDRVWFVMLGRKYLTHNSYKVLRIIYLQTS